MKRPLIISFFVIITLFEVNGQLLEDTQQRLKTARIESRGFLFFRSKKVLTSSGAHRQGGKAASPKYSKGGKAFRSKGVAPRYSAGSPFRGTQWVVSPKYSKGNPFRGAQFRVIPRYSIGNPFRGIDYRVSPKYSVGMPFSRQQFRVSPRYSAGNPFRGVDWKVRPLYSSAKDRFAVNKRARKWSNYSNQTYFFRGNWKPMKKGKGDQHPSSNYRLAMKFSNPKVRKVFRKWNAFWVRMNGNKEEPKGVKASVRSPKFDKKEKDIWNN